MAFNVSFQVLRGSKTNIKCYICDSQSRCFWECAYDICRSKAGDKLAIFLTDT